MTASDRQMHLALFALPHGQLASSWRLAEIPAHSTNDFAEYREAARLIQAARFDAFFIADKLTIGSDGSWQYGPPVDAFEPFTLGGALAAVTEKLGVIATASTTYQHPYSIARQVLALDHLSQGRAGWNIVTSYSPDTTRQFGSRYPHDERYDIAQESVDVVRRLWRSWDEDAVAWDREAGTYTRPGAVRPIDHRGRYFEVAGPGEYRRSMQGEPVRVQAGSSGRGMAFAARHAEMIFTAQTTLESGVAFAEDIRRQVREAGRRESEVVIMPGFSFVVGSTEEEAQRIQEQLLDTVQPEHILGSIRDVTQIDLREYPIDGPVPPLPDPATVQGHQSRLAVYKQIAETEQLSLRDFARRVAAQRGHHQVVGSPERIADQMQDWFEHRAADGFNLMPHTIPGQLRAFTEELAEETGPLAEARGLDVVVMDLDDLTMDEFVDVRDALLLVSTAGDGDMLSTAEQFWLDISRVKKPPLPNLRYGVLALGDSSYAEFCAAGKKVDAQLEVLGATRVLDREDCDVDYEAPARAWLSAALDYFLEHPRVD